jgi:hypothetical protein
MAQSNIKDTNAVVEQKLTAALNVELVYFGLGRVLTGTAKPLGGALAWRALELLQSTVVSPHACTDIFSFDRTRS